MVLQKSFLKVRGKGSKSLLDKKELIKLILSREQGISIDKFAHYASNSPQIDFLSIISSNKQLGRPIPPGSYIISHDLFFFFNLPGETKVAYFESVILTDKQIFWFDIPMDDIEIVKVDKTFEKLEDETLYNR